MREGQPVDRRQALKQAAGTATAAVLGVNPYFESQLQGRVNQVLDFVMSQRFLDELKAVLDSAPERQLEVAATRFDPSRLEQNGITPPKGTRISSRVFDEDSHRSQILGAPKSPIGLDLRVPREKLGAREIQGLVDKNRLVAGSPGWGVCICVGAERVCVGVGTSAVARE
jgi:hypothetical protein